MASSSLSMTWALYPELHRPADAALVDRLGVGVGQADQPGRAVWYLPGQPGRAVWYLPGQPGRAVWYLPGQPGAGLGHDRRGAPDRDRQLIRRPPQPAPHPPAEGLQQRPSAVA